MAIAPSSPWSPARLVFDPNTTNGFIMDGDSNNANAIWLRNWREVGLENAMKTGGWCIQVLVAGGPSEMQRAEESMARSEGVPVIKLHFDKEHFVYSGNIGTYLEALFEAMKTKPKAVERTITYCRRSCSRARSRGTRTRSSCASWCRFRVAAPR